MRRFLRIVILCLAFGVAAHFSWRLELLCRREVYHALESLGAITPTGNFWGQIMGRNIPRHPAWMTAAVRGVGTLGALPALLLALGAYLVITTPRVARRTPGATRLALIGAIPAAAAYALAVALLEPTVHRLVQSGAFELGKLADCGYFQSGPIGIGPNGPFMEGRWAGLFNFLWSYTPHPAMGVAALLCALAAFHPFARRIARRRAPGTCSACGYSLTGLSASACPECGGMLSVQTKT